MISLAVSRGGRGVGMGSKVMEFCGSIVRALWHDVSLASWMIFIRLLLRLSAVCVLSMMYFALNTSAGRPAADRQDFFRLAARFRTSQCCL